MATGMETMREVVAQLRRENSDALLELREFEEAMREVLRSLDALAVALAQLRSSVAEVAGGKLADPAMLRAVEASAAKASSTAGQLVSALREFCRGMSGWGITERG